MRSVIATAQSSPIVSGCDLLVGAHEAPQRLGVEAAVGVGDKGPGHAEHPRISGERPVGELGQLPVVARRQIVADLADLLFDDVIVVDQPFRRRRDRASFLEPPWRWCDRPRAAPPRCRRAAPPRAGALVRLEAIG